jgi:gluconate kinase
MSNPIYLITGPSGSGKSEVANYLEAQGHQSIDADNTPGLCYFVNKNNKPVPYPQGAGTAWWDSHNYVWELDRLRKLLDSMDTKAPIFVCGSAGNIAKAWPMFEQVYYLDIPKNVMQKRIASGRRDNSFGQRVDDSEQLMRWAEPFKEEMLSLGATSVDATQSVDKIAKAILAQVKASASA